MTGTRQDRPYRKYMPKPLQEGRKLSRQRRAVLIGLANGLTSRQMAKALNITEQTVDTTIDHLYLQLEVHSRGHAVAVGFVRQILRAVDILAEGQCPGAETYPNYCKCRCEGCKHNCAAHRELL